ncbi:MAG TPA: type VI secretion protein IcmF/TssM N-terminal domain-containing protein [Verrucomicrobiae bacterium]|nr:type VI secretion protein IcmF/TssM N-terminal domain-containing protein [Verrucomicrobiae bacterium]
MPFQLRHIEGSKAGALDTFDQDRIRIGRQPDNDLTFDPQKDASVSGYHAEIYRDGDAVFLQDLQSRNGTFVNGRKIDQPVLLKDGDVVQFSARGPKVSFLTGDASAEGKTAVFESQELTPKDAEQPKPPPLWRRILPGALVALTVIVLFGVGWFLGVSWSSLLLVAAAALLVGGCLFLLWRLWKRRAASREQQRVEREERDASAGRVDRDNVEDLKQKWTEVVRKLRSSNLQRGGEDSIYALPWFLVLGESGSGKTAFIKEGGPLSSIVSRMQTALTRNCDWWFFDKAVLLDTAGRYAFQSKNDGSAGEWHELLKLLKSQRRKEPINGAIVVLPSNALGSKPVERLKDEAAQLRQRLDEMVHQLGIRFPVYLVISKCDLLAGFNEFFESLPESEKAQAMGFVNSDPVNAGASGFPQRAFRTIYERAARLQVASLAEVDRDDAARRLFIFPAELKTLQEPLKVFLDVLFRPSPYQDPPFFRGIFFATSRQDAAPTSRLARILGLQYSKREWAAPSRDLFSRDLFSVILPNDRGMVRRTALWRESYQLARMAGLVITATAALILCGLFTLSFTSNKRLLSRLDVAPCVGPALAASARPISDAVRVLDNCRENIDGLNPKSFWRRLALNFGLRQTRRISLALEDRFSKAFRARALDPLDARIDQKLAAGPEATLLVGAILQRSFLLAKCQDQGGCPDAKTWERPNYRVLLALEEPNLKDGDFSVDRLRDTHEAYLLWQKDPKIFADLRAKDYDRIRRWLSSGGLREEWILESTKGLFPPVQVRDFWGMDLPGQPVDSAYTARAWREGISPLLSGLQKMASDAADVGTAVKRFEASYKAQGVREWGRFLAEFPEAEKTVISRGMNRDLELKILSPESPYHRVLDSAASNLETMIGTNQDLPAWMTTLRQYGALKKKLLEAQKAGKPAADAKAQGKEAEAQAYFSAYFESLGQLRGELSTTEKSFRSTQKTFEEGEPSAKASQPVLRALWNLNTLRGTIGFPQDEDRVIWVLLGRPVAIAWRAMLAEAGQYLQQQWEGLLLEMIDLPPGPKGAKIISFVNGSASAFLERRGGRYVPRRLLDQNVPFTGEFTQYLLRLRPENLQSGMADTAALPDPPRRIVRVF